MNNQQRTWFPFQNAFEHFTIDPYTNWSRFINPQFFISYNTDDVEVENSVLHEVGSYGKQLGKIIDVLEVLIAHLPQGTLDTLTIQEQRSLDEFHDLSQKVNSAVIAVKGPRRQEITPVDIDRMINSLQSMAHSNPVQYRRLVDRLRKAIGKDGTSKSTKE